MTTYDAMTAEEREQVEAKKTKRLEKGFYGKPRALLWLRKKKIIAKSEYLLIDILLHLENQFAKGKTPASKRGKWFFCSNKDICSYGLISDAVLNEAKKSLKLKGFIDYKSGHTDKATEYHILDIEGYLPAEEVSA